jgi:hypothetical protein
LSARSIRSCSCRRTISDTADALPAGPAAAPTATPPYASGDAPGLPTTAAATAAATEPSRLARASPYGSPAAGPAPGGPFTTTSGPVLGLRPGPPALTLPALREVARCTVRAAVAAPGPSKGGDTAPSRSSAPPSPRSEACGPMTDAGVFGAWLEARP